MRTGECSTFLKLHLTVLCYVQSGAAFGVATVRLAELGVSETSVRAAVGQTANKGGSGMEF